MFIIKQKVGRHIRDSKHFSVMAIELVYSLDVVDLERHGRQHNVRVTNDGKNHDDTCSDLSLAINTNSRMDESWLQRKSNRIYYEPGHITRPRMVILSGEECVETENIY